MNSFLTRQRRGGNRLPSAYLLHLSSSHSFIFPWANPSAFGGGEGITMGILPGDRARYELEATVESHLASTTGY
jgi:hypothetical protein